MNSPLVIVALGSNLGDSVSLLHQAIERLSALAAGGFSASSLWRTAPVDCPPGTPDFVNATAVFEPRPGETPLSLLGKLQQLESEFGRRPKKIRNESRPLDLDLITFGNQRIATPALILPHPRAHLRRFVLCPLSEIAPDLVLPGQQKSIKELLEALDSPESVRQI